MKLLVEPYKWLNPTTILKKTQCTYVFMNPTILASTKHFESLMLWHNTCPYHYLDFFFYLRTTHDMPKIPTSHWHLLSLTMSCKTIFIVMRMCHFTLSFLPPKFNTEFEWEPEKFKQITPTQSNSNLDPPNLERWLSNVTNHNKTKCGLRDTHMMYGPSTMPPLKLM